MNKSANSTDENLIFSDTAFLASGQALIQCIFVVLFSTLGAMSNGILMLTVLLTWKLRKMNAFFFLILMYAFEKMIVSITTFTFYLISIERLKPDSQFPMPQKSTCLFACSPVLIIDYSTPLIVLMLSLDRVLAICNPEKYKIIRSKKIYSIYFGVLISVCTILILTMVFIESNKEQPVLCILPLRLLTTVVSKTVIGSQAVYGMLNFIIYVSVLVSFTSCKFFGNYSGLKLFFRL